MSSRLSVVVPLYNKQREVARCIESLLRQSFSDFVAYIVNDGSTDKGAEVVARYADPRIRLIHQENRGLAGARNRGVEESATDVIAFLDADDEWRPEYLANLSRLAEQYPQAGAYFSAYWVDRGGGWRRRIRIGSQYRADGLLRDYFSVPPGRVLPSATAVRRQAFYEAGEFRKMFGEDIDLWLRIAALYPVAYSPEPDVVWHVDASDRMCVQQASETKPHDPTSLHKSLAFVEANARVTAEAKQRARQYIAKRELKAVVNALMRKDQKQASELFLRWQAEYRSSAAGVKTLLKLPPALMGLAGKLSQYKDKAITVLEYLVERPANRKVFGRR